MSKWFKEAAALTDKDKEGLEGIAVKFLDMYGHMIHEIMSVINSTRHSPEVTDEEWRKAAMARIKKERTKLIKSL